MTTIPYRYLFPPISYRRGMDRRALPSYSTDRGHQATPEPLSRGLERALHRADSGEAFAAHARTFQVGMQSMGGSAIPLDHTVSRLGERESVPDMARNLSRWVQGIVARVFEQSELEQLAEYASIPVINALSDRFHPCQAYADFFTLQERFGNLRGLKLAYVGDGNNVCHSLMMTGARWARSSRGHTQRLRARAGDRGRGARVPPETVARSSFSIAPRKRWRARRPFTPTFGPAWARKRRPRRARKYSRPTR